MFAKFEELATAAWNAVLATERKDVTVLSAKDSGGWGEGAGHLFAIPHLVKTINCSEVILSPTIVP